MSFYAAAHRALQDRHGTRRLADLLEAGIMHAELTEDEADFIAGRDTFFLATVDPEGRPTVSHKGGAPGFVRVLAPNLLAFPNYDGNGMFYSMGNIAAGGRVGLLFIDFETPHRLRVQGGASVDGTDPLLAAFPGANLVVRVEIETVFVNCPRYIHRRAEATLSRYVPDAAGNAPIPAWKRLDFVQPTLTSADQAQAAAAGWIDMEQYEQKRRAGDA